VLAAGGIPFALFAIVGASSRDRLGRRNVMIAADLLRVVVQAATATLLSPAPPGLDARRAVVRLRALGRVVHAGVHGPHPAGGGPGAPTGGQRADRADPQPRERRRPAIAGAIIAISGPGEAIAIDAATFVISAACLLRLRVAPARAAAPGPGASAGFFDQLREGGTRCARARGCAGDWSRWPATTCSCCPPCSCSGRRSRSATWAARRAGRSSSPAAGVGSIAGNVIALRLPVRRPVFVAALALVGASLQAAVIGSGLGTGGIAVLQTLSGVCVALFFTLWDTSIQEQVPPAAVSRVSSYDFTASMGLMPIGMAIAGPVADAVGLHATLVGMSVLGVASALAWLAQPSVRALERPRRAVAEEEAHARGGRGLISCRRPRRAPAGARGTGLSWPSTPLILRRPAADHWYSSRTASRTSRVARTERDARWR
jgi:MFS family permease